MMIDTTEIIAVCLQSEIFHVECFEKQHTYEEVTQNDLLLEIPEERIAFCD